MCIFHTQLQVRITANLGYGEYYVSEVWHTAGVFIILKRVNCVCKDSNFALSLRIVLCMWALSSISVCFTPLTKCKVAIQWNINNYILFIALYIFIHAVACIKHSFFKTIDFLCTMNGAANFHTCLADNGLGFHALVSLCSTHAQLKFTESYVAHN